MQRMTRKAADWKSLACVKEGGRGSCVFIRVIGTRADPDR